MCLKQANKQTNKLENNFPIPFLPPGENYTKNFKTLYFVYNMQPSKESSMYHGKECRLRRDCLSFSPSSATYLLCDFGNVT